MEKTCNKCGETKSIDDFYKTGYRKDGSPQWRAQCKICYNTKKYPSTRKITPSKKVFDITKKSDKELREELNSRGYFTVKETVKQDQHYYFPKSTDEFKIGIVSDTHLGSKYQQLTHLNRFYELCADQGITDIFHAGDLSEGNGKQYRGQMYEMFLIGTSNKIKYISDHYPKVKGITTHFIGGNHDYCFFKTDGFDVLDIIASKREDMNYLGMFGAYLNYRNTQFYLMHGSGGVAYARSYKLQKIVQELASEQKPHIMLAGHYHTPCYLSMYRNVESFQLGCFQSQTPYLKSKGLYPAVQGLILDVKLNEDGLEGLKFETVHYYKPIEDDY